MPPKKNSCSSENDVLAIFKDDIDEISDAVKRVTSQAYQKGMEDAGPAKRRRPRENFPLKTTEVHRNTHVMLVAADSQKETEQQIFENDVIDMKDAILKAFPELSDNNIHTVIGKDVTDGTTVTSQVQKQLVNMRANFGKKDFFIFYYSGHMNVSRTDQSACTFHTGKRDEDYISDAELKALFKDLEATRYLFILDCCYASAASLGAKGKKLRVTQLVPKLPEFWKLFDERPSTSKQRQPRAVQWASCAADEESYYGKKSFFTQGLVNLLNGADGNIPSGPVNLKVLNGCLKTLLAKRKMTPQLDPVKDDSFYNSFLTFVETTSKAASI